MALDKNDSISQVNNLFPDNTSGEITPEDQRIVSTNAISSNLNIEELIEQDVKGSVDFLGGLKNDGIPLRSSTIQVEVKTLSNLPTPSGGEILLADNTTYYFIDTVDIGVNKLIIGESTDINSVSEFNIELIYTGTGDMITSVNKSFSIRNIGIRCANGTLFNLSDSAPVTESFVLLQNVTIWECKNAGDITSLALLSMVIVAFRTITDVGFRFFGSLGNLSVQFSLGVVFDSAFLDLGTATFNSIEAATTRMVIIGSGGFGVSGLTGSGNINVGGIGSIRNCRFNGAGSPIDGISTEDALWDFFGNDDIANSRPDALISLKGNSTETVISSVGVDVLVAGSWAEITSSQFTTTAAGRVMYNGGRPAKLPISVSTGITVSSGVNQTIHVHLFLNDTIIEDSEVSLNVDSTDVKNQVNLYQLTWQPGDYLELFVSNESTTNNVTVINSKFRVN